MNYKFGACFAFSLALNIFFLLPKSLHMVLKRYRKNSVLSKGLSSALLENQETFPSPPKIKCLGNKVSDRSCMFTDAYFESESNRIDISVDIMQGFTLSETLAALGIPPICASGCGYFLPASSPQRVVCHVVDLHYFFSPIFFNLISHPDLGYSQC